jgi:hypothetical protein
MSAKWNLERYMRYVDDKELLDVYNELESGKVPATGYAHGFNRKVNRMIDSGDLCISDGKYRHIYLPTLSKAVYREMARRYATYMCNYKAPTANEPAVVSASVIEDDDVHKCAWCNGEYDSSDLIPTDLGMLCEHCIMAIRSRGEDVSVNK